MPPRARAGFHRTGDGIHFWFLDKDEVANFLGPVSFLEPLEMDAFLLETAKGLRYRVQLDPQQLGEFRGLGGMVRMRSPAGPAARTQAKWGFQKTESGIFFWYRGQHGVKYLGPIIRLNHIQDDRYSLLTKKASHAVRLGQENVAEFQRLGGAVLHVNDKPAAAPGTVVSSRPLRTEPVFPEPVSSALSPRRDRSPVLWHGSGSKVRVGPHEIVDPMVYFSRGTPNEDEASCIDLSLPVGKPVVEPQGALGYWPQYRTISPNQRANYLSWLSGGRDGHLEDIGYAFIFLYGLERRVLVDNKEINPVTCEIVRLLNRYTSSGAFSGYLSRLLAYVIVRTGIEKLHEEWFNKIFEESRIQPDEEILALALAWHIKRGQPLSATWAKRMAQQHPQAQRSMVAERVPEQLQALFTKKYKDRFGPGLQLKAGKRDRNVHYLQPASPSLLAIRNRNPAFADSVAIPNVLGLQSQFLPLVKIWTECCDELKSLSRQLAKGIEVNTRAAYEALPEGLKSETEHPDQRRWDEVVAQNTNEDGFVLASISRLGIVHGIAPRRRLTGKQSESLAETAEYVGHWLEPDARITGRAYAWDDLVALFRPEKEAKLPADNRYRNASLILELGLAVAAADGVITDEELGSIGHFLEGQFLLDQAESRRLKQLEQVFLQQHPSLAHVSKPLLKALTLSQRETLGRFLVGVAATNAEINEPTLKALRNAFRALEVDVARLDSFLDQLQGTNQDNDEDGKGTIPAGTTKFNLNRAAIPQILADTQEVAEMLRNALGQKQEEIDEAAITAALPKCPVEPPPPCDRSFPDVPARLQPLMATLLSRDTWSPADFENLVRANGFMVNGAIEQINDWAMEHLGDFLIEEGDPILVQRDMIRNKA